MVDGAKEFTSVDNVKWGETTHKVDNVDDEWCEQRKTVIVAFRRMSNSGRFSADLKNK